MAAFILQLVLWLLVAFLLGWLLGRFLRGLFCRDAYQQDIYAGEPVAVSRRPELDMADNRSSRVTAGALGGAAVATAGAVAVARSRPIEPLPDVELKVTTPPVPEVDVTLPEAKLAVPDVDVALPEVKADLPEIDLNLPEAKLAVPNADVTLPEISVGKPLLDWSGVDPHKPIIDLPDAEELTIDFSKADLPDIDVTLPEAKLAVPDVDVTLPELKAELPDVDVTLPELKAELPDVDVTLPEAKLAVPDIDVTLPEAKLAVPDVDINVPEAQVALPDVDVTLPEAKLAVPDVDVTPLEVSIGKPLADWTGIDPHKPIVDLPETGTGMWDTVKGAALAAGAGLVAKAASAFDWDKTDPHKPIVGEPEVNMPEVQVELPDLQVSLPEAQVAVPDVDITLPEAKLVVPDVDITLPEAKLVVPDVDITLPELKAELPDVDVTLPEAKLAMPEVDVTLPEVKAELPDVNVALPELKAELPNVDVTPLEVSIGKPLADWTGIDPHKPIVDLSEAETGDNLGMWDTVKGAALAAGAGLVAKTATAFDWDKANPHKPIVDGPDQGVPAQTTNVVAVEQSQATPETSSVAADAVPTQDSATAAVADVLDLHKPMQVLPEGVATNADGMEATLESLVQQAHAAYQGKSLRIVSRLWDASSTFDCSAMRGMLGDKYEMITLGEHQYERLGVFHCGVTQNGFVAVGGDVCTLAAGEAVLFHYPNIVVCRTVEDEYHFIQLSA